MASLKDLAESRSAVLNFDPRKLKVKPGLNARDLTTPENVEHIEWLAFSISTIGVKKPLEVFSEGDDVFVSDGHCRLAAVMLAISRGIEVVTVPCIPESRGTSEIDRVLNQNVSNSGKRLTPLEEGVNIKRAIALGATVAQVAAKLGRSLTYVAQALDFQAAPAEVHELVRSGEVSATLAAKTIRREGAAGVETIKKAVETAKAQGKSHATEKHIPVILPAQAAPEPAQAVDPYDHTAALVAALRPLAAIADAYDANGLDDEARRFLSDNKFIALADCFAARAAIFIAEN